MQCLRTKVVSCPMMTVWVLRNYDRLSRCVSCEILPYTRCVLQDFCTNSVMRNSVRCTGKCVHCTVYTGGTVPCSVLLYRYARYAVNDIVGNMQEDSETYATVMHQRCPDLQLCIVVCRRTVLYSVYCTLLYCTVLYFTLLYCTMCTVFYCIVLYCTQLYCTLPGFQSVS